MAIAKRIRGFREQKCLSLDDLAARAGLPASVISRLEDGREIPTCEVLERLAEALAVPVFLLFYSDEQLPLTPHLTPRPRLRELAEEPWQSSKPERLLLKPWAIVRAIKVLLRREVQGSTRSDLPLSPQPPLPSPQHRSQNPSRKTSEASEAEL